MRKSWVTQALKPSSVKRAPSSASYAPYSSGPAKKVNAQGPSTNPLPPGARIGPKNKVKGYSQPAHTENEMQHVFDKRISGKGYGSNSGRVSFDPQAKRAPFAPSPTSKKGSSGKAGPSKYVGSR